MAFTAQDVKALRDSTGAGMMDCKRALEETDGDIEAAKQHLREKGLAASAKRDDRENNQGVVALKVDGAVGAIVQLKSETDFVAKNSDFVNTANDLAELVAKDGEGATGQKADAIDDLKVILKENIEMGSIARIEAKEGQVLDTYLHTQDGRGVNGVIVLVEGGTVELAHDIAVHIAFAKPQYLNRDEIPQDVLDEERKTFENTARNTGKPEAALPKIAEGMLNGWIQERTLVEQKFAKDEKQTVKQVVGDARIVEFAQLLLGS